MFGMKALHIYFMLTAFSTGCLFIFFCGVNLGVNQEPQHKSFLPASVNRFKFQVNTSKPEYALPSPQDTSPKHVYFRTVIQALLKREEANINIEEVEKLYKKSLEKPTRRKLILAYTPFFGSSPWPMFDNTTFNSFLWEKGCPMYNCDFTCDKKYLNVSDAVLFHGRDMTPLAELRSLMNRKSPHQRWVFYLRENPINTFLNLPQYNGIFNWTMTYRTDSDIYVPGGVYYRVPTNMTGNENYAKGKDKLIYWPVSNCGNSRDNIAKKLSEFVQVDVYGGCRRNFPKSTPGLSCPRNSKECDTLMRSYKFRLSFENKNCVDYITEKYWYPLEKGNIPIVLGGASYDSKLVVPGSYINALDFPSVKALADYIQYLDKNDTAYNEYFQWKKYYHAEENVLTFPCHLCTALNIDLKPRVYDNIDTYWGKSENCGANDAKMRNML
ncbi:alpha-(1,3)-fucosyltransferase C-like [Nematostella vectensis]|uniref:alpha-(1,3)-fucosyltransferase C-like n=1 Tax=Nematostella vectensis TaxID=45351 RepID=UPI0013904829|nr:alpha-(1,3)-fucosyltransferase C-like [Nematostella vectensis]